MENKRKNEKGRKPFKKPIKEEKPAKVCMNDPYWYVVHPELLKDVASLAFPEWLGRGIQANPGIAPQLCVLGIRYVYTLGVSLTSDSPANLAVRNMYTFVRHANSGHTNYESADLGLYLFAVGTLIATLAHIERIIGVAKYYQVRNSAVPQQVQVALGCTDWNTVLVPNLANYTAKLNVLWTRLSSVCIPKDFKFIERWIWMNSQVFKDHESSKAQLIVFTPCSVPIFNVDANVGGYISMPNASNPTKYIGDWFADAESAINNILGDEDMNIMSGDILKAYGAENLYKFGMTPLDYVVTPVFVEEMLPQVENLRSAPKIRITSTTNVTSHVAASIPYNVGVNMGSDFSNYVTLLDDPDTFIIYQVKGELISAPAFTYGAGSLTTATSEAFWCDTSLGANATWGYTGHGLLLNSKKESPTPEDVMVSTRLMYTERAEKSGTSAKRYIDSCGTEIVDDLILYCRYGQYNTQSSTTTEWSVKAGISAENLLVDSLPILQLDWAPITYFDRQTAAPTSIYSSFTELFGDLDNFTYLSASRLADMHLNAILGEFNVTNMNLIK